MTRAILRALTIVAALFALLPAGAQQPSATPADGTWSGMWFGQTRDGPMEMVIESRGDKLSGRVRSGNSPDGECPSQWTPLEGVVAGGTFTIEYTAPGRCGKTRMSYTLDAAGNVMTGSWSSAWPSYGTFKLTRQTR